MRDNKWGSPYYYEPKTGRKILNMGKHLIKEVSMMLSNIPFDLKALGDKKDVELLRIGIIAELDAINLYEQLASLTENELIRNVFLDIAREEKEHFGEFLRLLKDYDGEVIKAIEEGAEEVEELKSGGVNDGS